MWLYAKFMATPTQFLYYFEGRAKRTLPPAEQVGFQYALKSNSDKFWSFKRFSVVKSEGTILCLPDCAYRPFSGQPRPYLTDLQYHSRMEAAFRSLKSNLNLRPDYHQNDEQFELHIYLTILAYQLVNDKMSYSRDGSENNANLNLRQGERTRKKCGNRFLTYPMDNIRVRCRFDKL